MGIDVCDDSQLLRTPLLVVRAMQLAYTILDRLTEAHEVEGIVPHGENVAHRPREEAERVARIGVAFRTRLNSVFGAYEQ